ncbi:hypothetical protein Aduo_005312 [Ancylostoma duodenale]
MMADDELRPDPQRRLLELCSIDGRERATKATSASGPPAAVHIVEHFWPSRPQPVFALIEPCHSMASLTGCTSDARGLLSYPASAAEK